MIVADASVLVDVLLRSSGSDEILARLFGGRETVHAPHLLDVEVAQTIRRYVLRGEVADHHGREMLGIMADLPVRRYSHQPLLGRMWDLRRNVTMYDAAYIALAEALGCPLLTRDTRLSGTPGVSAIIEVT